MSQQLGPKKSLLKFKSSSNTSSTFKSTVAHKPTVEPVI